MTDKEKEKYKNILREINKELPKPLEYCDVISSKDSTTKCKVDFAHLMGNVAERIKTKCDKLEKGLEDERKKTNDN